MHSVLWASILASAGVKSSAHPVVWLSLINWQAIGIGFAFGGSIVLAIGLLSGAPKLAIRIARSRNSNSWQIVQVAESRADTQIGVLALVIGFGIQAGTTVWTVDHAGPKLTGGWSYLITFVWILLPVLLVWWTDRKTQWFWVRRYLLKLEYYNQSGQLTDQPSAFALSRYGSVIGEERRQIADESDADYLKRVWHVRHKHAKDG